ncbi:hypothetical protein AB4Y67_02860 [Arthrobacter sp. YAF17]|uniref:hypothetical protein n=1 Tax=Arthrobacter sp. YAF17 TaxID=3233077 RepID=UPI003F906B20
MTDLQHAETAERTTEWSRRCRRMNVAYVITVIVVQLPLAAGLFLVSFWLLNVCGPLLRGDVAFGHPAYEYLQESKDLLATALGGLTAILILTSVLLHRWWKRSAAALGPMPAELRPTTFKAWNRHRRMMRGSHLAGAASLLWLSALLATSIVSGVQEFEAWSARGGSAYDDPGYDEAHALLDMSIVLGCAGGIALILLSVSMWRSYGRAQQWLGPQPDRVAIRELEDGTAPWRSD